MNTLTRIQKSDIKDQFYMILTVLSQYGIHEFHKDLRIVFTDREFTFITNPNKI